MKDFPAQDFVTKGGYFRDNAFRGRRGQEEAQSPLWSYIIVELIQDLRWALEEAIRLSLRDARRDPRSLHWEHDSDTEVAVSKICKTGGHNETNVGGCCLSQLVKWNGKKKRKRTPLEKWSLKRSTSTNCAGRRTHLLRRRAAGAASELRVFCQC